MYNVVSVLVNDTHKLLWDFKIQADHLKSARRPDLTIVKKKKKKESAALWTLPSLHTSE